MGRYLPAAMFGGLLGVWIGEQDWSLAISGAVLLAGAYLFAVALRARDDVVRRER